MTHSEPHPLSTFSSYGGNPLQDIFVNTKLFVDGAANIPA